MPDEYEVDLGRLQLSFSLAGDRWSHMISIADENDWRSVLMSLEGAPQDRYPPSPAFQDLRLERIDDVTQEFQLMGQCGSGIYSAAIRCHLERAEIDFDLCLTRRPSRSGATAEPAATADEGSFPLSTYLVEEGARYRSGKVWLRDTPTALAIRCGEGSKFEPGDGEHHDRIAMRSTGSHRSQSGPKERVSSIRWRYVILFAAGD